jgi:hypothetical protein
LKSRRTRCPWPLPARLQPREAAARLDLLRLRSRVRELSAPTGFRFWPPRAQACARRAIPRLRPMASVRPLSTPSRKLKPRRPPARSRRGRALSRQISKPSSSALWPRRRPRLQPLRNRQLPLHSTSRPRCPRRHLCSPIRGPRAPRLQPNPKIQATACIPTQRPKPRAGKMMGAPSRSPRKMQLRRIHRLLLLRPP